MSISNGILDLPPAAINRAASQATLSRWNLADLFVSKVALAILGISTAFIAAQSLPLACVAFLANHEIVRICNPANVTASDSKDSLTERNKIAFVILPKILALGMWIGSILYATSSGASLLYLLGHLSLSGLFTLVANDKEEFEIHPNSDAPFLSPLFAIAERTRDPNTRKIPHQVLLQVQNYINDAVNRTRSYQAVVASGNLSKLKALIDENPSVLNNPSDVAQLLSIYRQFTSPVENIQSVPAEFNLWPYLLTLVQDKRQLLNSPEIAEHLSHDQLNSICSQVETHLTESIVANGWVDRYSEDEKTFTDRFLSHNFRSEISILNKLIQFLSVIENKLDPLDANLAQLKEKLNLAKQLKEKVLQIGTFIIQEQQSELTISQNNFISLNQFVHRIQQ